MSPASRVTVPKVTVVVTGLPASGKSTLAAAVAERLALPLLSLDMVKEALVDELGADLDRFAVRRAARRVLTDLAAASPSGSVIDIWVNPTRDEDDFLSGARGIGGAVVELVCRVPIEVALERYTGRERHPAHLPPGPDSEQRMRDAAPAIGPLGLGPHLDVDTTGPVDVPAVAAWILQAVA